MIWLLVEPVTEETARKLLPLLDLARREHLAAYRQPRSRVESILAGALLRYAWAQEYGGPLPDLAAGEHGKPAFTAPNAPQFNLSHCSSSGQTAVACALSRYPVGIDVQALHRYDRKFRRILSEREQAWVEEADSDARFTALWTRKEAYGKALGVGIGYEMRQTELSGNFTDPTAFGDWLFWTVPADGFALSVCAKERLEICRVSAETLLAFAGESIPQIHRKYDMEREKTNMFDVMKMKDACVQWIRDFFAENGPGCNAVLGISGGKDSSVAAALCVEALGRDRVVGVLMPNGVQHDIDMAYLLCDHLGIRRYEVNIHAAVEGVKSAIPAELTLSEQSLTNLPPRIRMSTLYAVSQSLNGRVVNTCNLSEDWVGYSTRYGDAAGDFSPMSHFTVDEVKQIGRALGLPDVLVDKVPIDGLCGKTDEDNLGFTYAVLDRYIRTGEIDDPAAKERIDTLHRRNLFKLRLMPSFATDLPELAE